jgi:hypothetical protein
MGQLNMSLYLHHTRRRYAEGTREEKRQILDEFCKSSQYHRKSAIRLLNKQPKPGGGRRRSGRKKQYVPEKLQEPLVRIWLATDQMCGKRLRSALPLWLPHYERHYTPLEASTKKQLLEMSPATIDRMLKPLRVNYKRGMGGTKPGSLLRTQIPIKTDQWDEERPGFVEADTVAHCGVSLKDDFVWSLTMTDIASCWTENRATWGKGSAGVLQQIQSIEKSLPFDLLGFDSDNGCEFLNYHLLRYFQEHPGKNKIQFTRSRPYKKNDNAHVEQKNYTHVRQLFGYDRFEKMNMVSLMNDLYAHEVSLLNNYFRPCIKLISKERINSKIKKKFDRPKTPYHRLLESTHIDDSTKQQLATRFNSLDPFALQKKIQKKLKVILSFATPVTRKQKRAI